MKRGDLFKGKRVRVINWKANGGRRPKHWNSGGRMDRWCGRTVIIAGPVHNRPFGLDIRLENDSREWSWSASDFESASNLSANNPNVIFMEKKRGGRK